MFILLKKIRSLDLPYDLQVELFIKTIKPILLYGSELWGFGDLKMLEKIQLKFFKNIFYLKQSTPSYMIYGELGILPLQEEAKIRMISYWCRVSDVTQNKLSNQIYSLILSLNRDGILNSKWLNYIKTLIQNNGFSNLWTNQNNSNKKWFYMAFKQKIKDQYIQTWNHLINNSSSSITYKMVKHEFKLNEYFSLIPNYFCKLLTAFRTRNHKLPIEVGRWHSIPINLRICPFCNDKNYLGDEMHYILEYKHFYKAILFYKRPNTLKFEQLFNSKNRKELVNLAKLINIVTKQFR